MLWSLPEFNGLKVSLEIPLTNYMPCVSDRYNIVLGMLEEELQENDDMVIVRGHDTYENLPSKVFGMLKYASSSPLQYSHVLKTDDDCYVRMPQLMNAIMGDDGKPLMRNLYTGCMESQVGFKMIRDPSSK